MTETNVPLFGQKSMPVEFPMIGDAPLYECPICGAAMRKDKVQLHGQWHHGEFRRNFSGF